MFAIRELLVATNGRLVSGRKDCNITGFSIDSRTIKTREAFIAIKGDNFNGHAFIDQAIKNGASCIIKQDTRTVRSAAQPPRRGPGQRVSLPEGGQDTSGVVCIEVKDTTRALADIALFLRQKFRIPLIAISGSNGKTTVKEMISWVLSARYKVLKNEGTQNNNIGLPLTLLKIDPSFDLAVLELGTNHFHEIENLVRICLPNIGVITNIGPAHLKYFGSLAGVFREKYCLIKNLQSPCIGILNNDDVLLKKEILKKNKHPLIFSFGMRNKSDFSPDNISCVAGRTEFSFSKQRFVLNTWGEYNIYNALCAIAVARIFGMPYRVIARRLESFSFMPGRLKIVKSGQATFIDDTYNANPLSLKVALDTFAKMGAKGRKIVVMGDMLELGKDEGRLHQEAGQAVAKVCDVFITVGALSKLAARAAKKCGMNKVFSVGSAKEAAGILSSITLDKSDLVLVKGSRAMKMEGVFS